MSWPTTPTELVAEQARLAGAASPPWAPPDGDLALGACFVCFPRGEHGPGRAGDRGWAAAVVLRGGEVVGKVLATGTAGEAYEPGLLALREGALLEASVVPLSPVPDVLLVDATGRDHPRRAGLALHLGAVLGLPTVGVTHRPLVARGEWPADATGATAPLLLDGALVGYWLRTRAGTRPLAVHAAWRTEPDTGVAVVLASLRGARTPEPLRLARTLARTARATASFPPA